MQQSVLDIAKTRLITTEIEQTLQSLHQAETCDLTIQLGSNPNLINSRHCSFHHIKSKLINSIIWPIMWQKSATCYQVPLKIEIISIDDQSNQSENVKYSTVSKKQLEIRKNFRRIAIFRCPSESSKDWSNHFLKSHKILINPKNILLKRIPKRIQKNLSRRSIWRLLNITT